MKGHLSSFVTFKNWFFVLSVSSLIPKDINFCFVIPGHSCTDHLSYVWTCRPYWQNSATTHDNINLSKSSRSFAVWIIIVLLTRKIRFQDGIQRQNVGQIEYYFNWSWLAGKFDWIFIQFVYAAVELLFGTSIFEIRIIFVLWTVFALSEIQS